MVAYFTSILFFFSVSWAQAKVLEAKEIKKGLTCLIDKDDKESANTFLLQREGQSILIDAGWSDKVAPPTELVHTIKQAYKVSTHFHFDHIRQWHGMEKIILTPHQAKLCEKNLCSPSRWHTVMKVKPFTYGGESSILSSENPLDIPLTLISCEGHSQTDACYLYNKTRTLFVGDLFYMGPVFYFLPGGKIDSAIRILEGLLARTDWDQLALSHGVCTADRPKLIEFVEDLRAISKGQLSWNINFDFWIPLRAYKVRSGYVVTNLFK